MIRAALILLSLTLLTGCDSISRTEIAVSDPTDGSKALKTDVIRIASRTAAQFGLNEVERRDTDTSFTDSLTRLGQNPDIWMTVQHAPDLNAIEINEMYTANPTDKHKQLAQSLVRNLSVDGYNATVVYQTPDQSIWPWLLGAALPITGIVAWVLSRKRRAETIAKIAT